jgi:hypothetical protein
MSNENANQEVKSIGGFMRFWLAFRVRIIVGAAIGAVLAIITSIASFRELTGYGDRVLEGILGIIVVVILFTIGGGVVGLVLPFIWKYIIKPILFVLSLFGGKDNKTSNSYSTNTETSGGDVQILNTSMNPIGFIRGEQILNTSMNPVGFIRGDQILNTSMNPVSFIRNDQILNTSMNPIGFIRNDQILNTSMNPIGFIRGNASNAQKGAGGFFLLNT